QIDNVADGTLLVLFGSLTAVGKFGFRGGLGLRLGDAFRLAFSRIILVLILSVSARGLRRRIRGRGVGFLADGRRVDTGPGRQADVPRVAIERRRSRRGADDLWSGSCRMRSCGFSGHGIDRFFFV